MSRSGNTSSVNRKITLENSPTVTSPDRTRNAPTTTSVMLVSDGITSSSASNQLRSRMACTREARTRSASPARRSVSRSSAP